MNGKPKYAGHIVKQRVHTISQDATFHIILICICGRGAFGPASGKSLIRGELQGRTDCELVIGSMVQGNRWPGLEICPLLRIRA